MALNNNIRLNMAFCSFPPGAETEEGAAETYRREGALEDEEVARKGTDDSEDPEGMSEDDFLAVNMEEKEPKREISKLRWQCRPRLAAEMLPVRPGDGSKRSIQRM